MNTCRYRGCRCNPPSPGRGIGRWWLLAVVLAAATTLRAAIPAAARDDPRFTLGYLVVTHYAGVRNDGTGDSTAGLQQAIDDAYAANLVCFLPLGTYVISDTLKCAQWHLLKSDGVSFETNPFKIAAFQISGEHGPAASRPLVRLVPSAATAPKFGDAAKPRPMLLLRLYESTRYPNPPRAEPADIMGAPNGWDLDTSYLFDCRLRNIDFDCEGQAGAIGVVWPAAQGACVESVRIDARGAHAGFYGLPGRNWGAVDLEVRGGEYGIRHGYGAGQAANREVCAGVTLVGVRLLGQTRRAIDYVDFVPLVMIGFAIEKDFAAPGAAAVPPISVVENTGTANNTLVLLDGSIVLRNAPPRTGGHRESRQRHDRGQDPVSEKSLHHGIDASRAGYGRCRRDRERRGALGADRRIRLCRSAREHRGVCRRDYGPGVRRAERHRWFDQRQERAGRERGAGCRAAAR